MKRGCFVLLAMSGCQLLFPLEDSEQVDPGTDCSKLRLLADDFSDGTLPPWINERSTRFGVAAEQLSATLNNNAAVAFTEPYYDLRSSSIQVQVSTSSPSIPGSAILALALLPTPDRLVDAIAMRVIGDSVQAGTITDEVFTDLRSIGNDPGKPFWRISYQDDVATFAIGDGEVFDDFHALTLPVTFVRPHVIGRIDEMTGFTVTFDEVNSGAGVGTPCPATALDDNFIEDVLDLQRWGRSIATNCTIAQVDGLSMKSTGSNWVCQLGGTSAYNLIDTTIEIDLAFDPMLNFPNTIETRFDVTTPGNLRGGFKILGDGRLVSYENTQAPNSPNPPGPDSIILSQQFDPARHRFLRIGAMQDGFGEQLVFEASPDGTQYESFLQTGNLTGLDQSVVSINMTAANPEPYALKVSRVKVRAR